MGLADGSIDMLVGTHAIFQEKVAYKNLGLAVIDEQHRFGVSQRLLAVVQGRAPAAPAGDDRNANSADADAHPIWRNGRQPDRRNAAGPHTGRNPGDQRGTLARRRRRSWAGTCRAAVRPIGFVRWSRRARRSDAAAAEERARVLRQRFGEDKVGLVHGRMKGPDKDEVMARFASGDLAVLVATTVIEVGVDVPNSDAHDRRGRRTLRSRAASPAPRARWTRDRQEHLSFDPRPNTYATSGARAWLSCAKPAMASASPKKICASGGQARSSGPGSRARKRFAWRHRKT